MDRELSLCVDDMNALMHINKSYREEIERLIKRHNLINKIVLLRDCSSLRCLVQNANKILTDYIKRRHKMLRDNLKELLLCVDEMNGLIHINKIYRKEVERLITSRKFINNFNKIALIRLQHTSLQDCNLLLRLVQDANKVLTEYLKKTGATEV